MNAILIPSWYEVLAEEVITLLDLRNDPDRIMHSSTGKLCFTLADAALIRRFVRGLSGDQLLELAKAVDSWNSAPAQQAYRMLHIDVTNLTPNLAIYAAGEAALALLIACKVQVPVL